ncbi:hypothetical protein B0H16DRAFT_1724316 [Mycena metata]|uniref:Uncharacterized protein n=1 Tax=Mycena metata TaxID=1033252 RepID=A0AAD7IUI3_9AGAR|nr:hypothetical protein B0H16DRAFT_1724316 [Mycena metata]
MAASNTKYVPANNHRSAPPGPHKSQPPRSPTARLPSSAFVGLALFVVLASGVYLGPSAGIPIPERFAPYYSSPAPPLPRLPPPPGAQNPGPTIHDFPTAADVPPPAHQITADADKAVDALLSAQPPTLLAARARYALRTGRTPPRGFDAFYAFAKERGCLVEGYSSVKRDFAPFWRVERLKRGWFRERVRVMEGKLTPDAHGVAALAIRDGKVQRPENGATYFDGDCENTNNKFATHLPALTVLINGRDEPRVVYDVGGLFDRAARRARRAGSTGPVRRVAVPFRWALAKFSDGTATGRFSDPPSQPPPSTDRTPFALAPPSTRAFFTDPARRDVCRPARGRGVVEDVGFLLSASSAEFTTDLVPVLSMAKIADPSTASMGGASCFADVVVPGEEPWPFPHNARGSNGDPSLAKSNSFSRSYFTSAVLLPQLVAGKFEYPNNVRWEDKKDVLYWRGKSNGGHIGGTIYKTFPRFRLVELAARPENVEKGLLAAFSYISDWGEIRDLCGRLEVVYM